MIFSISEQKATRKGPHIEEPKKILSYSRKDIFFLIRIFFSLWRPLFSWSGPPFLMMTLSTVNDDYSTYYVLGTPLLDSNGQ